MWIRTFADVYIISSYLDSLYIRMYVANIFIFFLEARVCGKYKHEPVNVSDSL
jgi:hypothetical protein